MKRFLEYLKDKNSKYSDLIITGLEYELDTNLLRFKIQYTCDNFSDEEKDQLERDISKFFGNSMNVECKLKMYTIDKDVVKEYASKFLESTHPNALSKNSGFVSVTISDNNLFKITIELDEDNYSYIADSTFVAELQEYLSIVTKEEFSIKLVCLNKNRNSDILRQRQDQMNSGALVKAIEYDPIEVRSIHNIVGEIDVDYVYAIATITEQEKATMVGTISFLRVSDYESRFKNKDGTARIAKRVNFQLKDGSDKISCVYFPNIADEEKIDELQEGEKVVVVGDVADGERGRSCKIKSIGLCDFDPIVIVEPEIEWKTVNEDYTYIFPKSYTFNQQADLFAGSEVVDDFLMNNTIVVFDLETTGLDVNECEIIEIGAVKMVNGKIVEVFETLVKPKNPIPPDATAVNNITNEMVEDCLSIDLVFPDFYKFIDGCVLCAYNIGYDCGVLKAYGDKNGYAIDNKQVDVLKLARKSLPSSHKGFRLGRVVKLLDITLDNAHRALADTIATAEVLKKTLNMLDDESKNPILGL